MVLGLDHGLQIFVKKLIELDSQILTSNWKVVQCGYENVAKRILFLIILTSNDLTLLDEQFPIYLMGKGLLLKSIRHFK